MGFLSGAALAAGSVHRVFSSHLTDGLPRREKRKGMKVLVEAR
jgi:hypothetical protein